MAKAQTEDLHNLRNKFIKASKWKRKRLKREKNQIVQI